MRATYRAHGGVQEPIDEHRSGGFVDFIFDRLAPQGDFNHHIDVVGRVFAGFNFRNVHGLSPDYARYPISACAALEVLTAGR